MKVFVSFLLIAWLILMAYTVAVIRNHGMGFLPVFFSDIATMGWPGQFNMDFTLMLSLAAIWIAWRHRYSSGGLFLAALALIGGAGFMYPYVMIQFVRANGDPTALLLGQNQFSRADRSGKSVA